VQAQNNLNALNGDASNAVDTPEVTIGIESEFLTREQRINAVAGLLQTWARRVLEDTSTDRYSHEKRNH
jgi:hypothetical protein